MSPEPFPENPLPVAKAWLDEAAAGSTRRNPLAMGLATCTPDGRPSLRMVLLKQLSVDSGYIVFFTNYGSRKGAELDANRRAAAVLYWEEFGRQLRVEGLVVTSPAAESDAYFRTRPLVSQLNALVSAQSRPIEDSAMLRARGFAKAAELGIPADALESDSSGQTIARPEFWGGYRLWIERIELWTEGAHRFHERHLYTRELEPAGERGFTAGAWRHTCLQP